MNKYAETLDSLVTIKKGAKKKVFSSEERKKFQDAWISLAINEGFSEEAEQFLYDGFAFCGAEPFYVYLAQTQDPNATLITMFRGKMYSKDSNVTFRLITHLLALMLNNNASQNILAPIIKRFPEACQNKGKKRLGTAKQTMEKYFLAVLSPNVELCPLADIVTKPIFIDEFTAVVSSVIADIENSGTARDAIADNITKVRKWISDYDATKSQSSDAREPNLPLVNAQTDAAGAKEESRPPEAAESVKPVVPTEKLPEDLDAYLADLLQKAGIAVSALRKERIQQEKKADILEHALEGKQEELRHANQQIAELQDTIASLRQKLSVMESDAAALRQAIVKRDTIISERDTEIAERIKLTEVLSRDRTKQADEALHRMASKIRIEYKDFQDAADVPMSCDLGENLRVQLQSIFDILEKGGMKIK